MNRRRKTLIALLLIALALGAAWKLRARVLPAMLWWLDVGEEPCEGDCAMILAGAENTRPWRCAALYRAGLVRRVLVTRVATSLEAAERLVPRREEINRRVLLHCGVGPEAIELIGHDCTNTFQEAEALGDFLETSPQHRILVVTSSFHTRRARWAMRQALKGRDVRVVVVSAPEGRIAPHNWWHTREGFDLVVAEYFKLAFYTVRYGWGGYCLAAGAVLVVGLCWWRRRRRARAAA